MTPDQATAIMARIDDLHDDVREVKTLARATNGRVRKLELWQARLQGAKAAVGWIPPTLTALGAAVIGAAAAALFG